MDQSVKDIKLIEVALNYIWNGKLIPIFSNRALLAKIRILMWDKNYLYFLTREKVEDYQGIIPEQLIHKYLIYIKPHTIPLADPDFLGWRNGVKKEFLANLPQELATTSQLLLPRISGPTAKLMLRHHKLLKRTGKRPLDPYTTEESFMVTIVHEFGHAYFDSTYLPWHGIKKHNLKVLNSALALFLGRNINTNNLKLNLPQHLLSSEVFAFCCEYFSSMLFWPLHQRAIDLEMSNTLPELIHSEEIADLNYQPSIFDTNNAIHSAAAVLGRILIAKYKEKWSNFFDN